MTVSPKARRDEAGRVGQAIDDALYEPVRARVHTVLRLAKGIDTEVLAERIRRRATLHCRRARARCAMILHGRDRLIAAVYAHAAPRGWCSAWSDGSMVMVSGRRRAGIGVLLADHEGEILTRLSRAASCADAFAAELRAAQAALELAQRCGATHVRVNTDCAALVSLWNERRDDERLDRLRTLARGFVRVDLQRIPRRHNQPANRLARAAAAERGSFVDACA